jgi:prevent-host-death family protein
MGLDLVGSNTADLRSLNVVSVDFQRVRRRLVKLINLGEMTKMGHSQPSPSVPMKTIAAADAKTNFGALLDNAQREPVTISKNGRAVAVVMSAAAFEEQQQLKLRLLREEVRKGLDELERGDVVSAVDAFARADEELSK